jgi:hypothetical protein
MGCGAAKLCDANARVEEILKAAQGRAYRRILGILLAAMSYSDRRLHSGISCR